MASALLLTIVLALIGLALVVVVGVVTVLLLRRILWRDAAAERRAAWEREEIARAHDDEIAHTQCEPGH